MRRIVLIGGALGIAAVPALSAPGDTQRASLTDSGSGAALASRGSAVSADGRYVLFTSRAAMTAAPANGLLQLYVRDRLEGRTRLVSAGLLGQPADADVAEDPADHPYAVSGDGRYAVFASSATNLAAADANGAARDVFRKDLVTGAIDIVSRSSAGAQSAGPVAGDPDISADGRIVAFTGGSATDLAPGDTSPLPDVLVRDVDAGTTIAANAVGAGPPVGPASRPAVSADGRVVVFEAGAAAGALVPGDANGAPDVVRRDLATGALTLASVAASGSAPGGAGSPDVSGDGRYVAFLSATPFTADPSTRPNVYRRDVQAGATVLASAVDGTAGTAGDGAAGEPSISADGDRVAFATASSNLVAPDANGATADVVVRTVSARTTVLAGRGVTQPAAGTTSPAISPDGGVVAFGYDDTGSGPLVPGDVNLAPDVFTRELVRSDATGPAVTVTGPPDGARVAARVVPVAATATDPSGVVSVTVDGRPLARGGAGAFSGTALLAAGVNTLSVVAVDGAGNTTTVTRTVVRPAPGVYAVAPPARATRVRARLAGSRVRIAFRLSAAAVVVADVRRVTITRPGATPATTPVARARGVRRAAGARTVVVGVPRLRAGTYRARVTVVSAGGLTQASALLVVRGRTGRP